MELSEICSLVVLFAGKRVVLSVKTMKQINRKTGFERDVLRE